MAANLSRNLNDIKKITQYTSEANRMGISVLRPDVNESGKKFTVTGDKVIRFGMAAIKGVGEAAVEQIVEERTENGHFKNIFDFAKRVNLRAVNKRSFEALAMAGAFDGFSATHRAQYFYKENEGNQTFIENVIRFGASFQEQKNSQQTSLFGDSDDFEVKDPEIPICPQWTLPYQLKMEKQVTGFYISGHPLDEYRLTMNRFCNIEVSQLRNNLAALKGQKVMFAGMITESVEKLARNGSSYGIITIEDFAGTHNLMLFSEDYLKKKHMLELGNNVFVVANVEERYNQPGNLNVQISDIFLLGEAMGRLAKNIAVTIDVANVDKDFVNKLNLLVKNNAGDCEFQVFLRDKKAGILLQTKSSSVKIEPRMFVHALTTFENIEYRIN
jgi:DNA polymerase-3 subunit alpha